MSRRAKTARKVARGRGRRARGSASHEAPAAQPLEEKLRSLPVRIARWTAAVVGFAATLTGLIFALWPALKPEGPPAVRSAKLSNLAVDRNITFGQYLDRIEQSRRPYGRAELAERGVLVQFDFAIQGYKGKRLPLRWQLIDARSGEQLDQSRDLLITPLASSDSGSWPVWVKTPRGRSRRLYVQLQLYNDRGSVPLSRLRTETFSGS
jgi:hypothetical protein